MPISSVFCLYSLCFLLLLARAQHTTYIEPVHRFIPKITGSINNNDTLEFRSASPTPIIAESSSSSSRTLYTNDGHSSGTPSGIAAANSWEDLNNGVFPQRNEEYPEPVFSQFIPSIQRPPARVEKPVISAELPAQEWLVSGFDWVENNYFYSSNVEYGRPSYVVDKDLGSQVHLTFDKTETTTHKPCFIVFNLRKGYSIAALRLRPSWSNGPKQVALSFSAFITGPWAQATIADVAGADGGSYMMERWQGKVVQGYRDHNLKTTIEFDAGFRLNGRFLRLDILDVWEGVYGKTQAVLKEVEFYGQALQTSLALGEERLCAWPTVYDDVLSKCNYLNT